MAEVENPGSAVDWTFNDRVEFSERWNGANVFNIMRPQDGASEYRTIEQRAAFYDWFDQVAEVQGHDIRWPAAAWIVATQMANVDKVTGAVVISEKVRQFARDGNKAIFDDVFPKLSEVFQRGLRAKPLKGDEAKNWDAETLRHEQFVVVQPLYQQYAAGDQSVRESLAAMAGGKGIYWLGGVAIGSALDFRGDIMKPQDRYDHGMNTDLSFYNSFKQAISSSRNRRQRSKPDPSAGGRVRVMPTQTPTPPPTGPHPSPIMLQADVLFAFDSSKLKADAESILRKAAEIIQARPKEKKVSIEGHADAMGSALYNQNLSLERARAVKQWFVARNITDAQSFVVTGLGETKPIAPNKKPDGTDNHAGRQLNRRVEIRFQ